MRMMIILVLVLPRLLWAQAEEKEDIWQPLRPLIGEWKGKGSGASGASEIEARYEFALGDRYIEAWHRSVFEPTERKPEGAIHEDTGFISYDSGREAFILRQFHVEGFVNTYVLDSLSADGNTLVFVTEAVENAPPGTRVRWEIVFRGEDELATSFHVAWSEGDYQCFSQDVLSRQQPGE